MTGRSITLLCACVALLAAGLSTGVPAYYALCIAAFTLALLCFVSAVVPLYTLRVQLNAPSVRAVRGEGRTLQLRVRYRAILPVGALSVELVSPDGMESVDVTGRANRLQAHLVEVACPHRGVYTTGVEEALVQDVFGLFALRRKLSAASVTIEVAPRVFSARVMDLGAGDTGPEAPNRSTEDDSSPSGIRLWREGDELKKIHWKLSMRRRELMVRTYEESARPDFLILADLSPIGALPSLALSMEDALCEAAASSAVAHLREGYPVRMPLSCSQPVECAGRTPADAARFLDALTSVPFDCSYPFEKLLSVEMRRMHRTGGALLVTTRLSVRTADLAMQMRRSGLAVRICWVTESRESSGSEIVARLALSGIEVERVRTAV